MMHPTVPAWYLRCRREEITGAVDDDIDSAEILDSRVDDLSALIMVVTLS